MDVQTTRVLIVGAGPTGLLASILLSRWGVPHRVVERRASILEAPAAHVINTRTSEILRQAGIPMDELYALDRHPDAKLVTWMRRLDESVIGQIEFGAFEAYSASRLGASQDRNCNISQHILEEFLLNQARKSPLADIRYGVRWTEFVNGDTRRNRLVPDDGESFTLEADFVLAADGAGSSVSRALNIKKIGPDAIASFVNLSCEVAMSDISDQHGTLLYWLLDPDLMGTVIVHDPERLAVFARPIATPYETFEDYDEERCNKLLRGAFRGKPYKLLHRSVWKMTAQIAERFRHDNVFLVGDSAHRFPPTGGLGLNTGAGDVHNLVWKLASVLAGDLDPSTQEQLLESYQQERKPVAQTNSDVSLRNSQKMMEVIEAIGLDPAKADLLPKIMNSFPVRILPEGLRRVLRNFLQKPVHARLKAAAADNQRGREIREKVARATANQEEHFNSFGLDLGYVYREGCVVSPEAKATPANGVTTYEPIAAAGARLPHIPIRIAGEQRSTQDLLSYDGFTLFKSGAAPGLQQSTFNLPVVEVDIADSDYKESFDSLSGAFNLEPGGWILVRPDGHVMVRGAGQSMPMEHELG